MPIEQEKIYVRFNLFGRMVQWETTVTLVYDMQRNLADIPLRVFKEVLQAKVTDYEEIAATVQFVTNMTFDHLDNRRRKVSKSTWTCNETLAILDDNDVSADSEGLTDDSYCIDSSSFAAGDTHGVTEESAGTDTPRHIITSLQSFIVYMRHRMISLDHILNDVTRCTHDVAWESRV